MNKSTVLYIDDDPINLELFRESFKNRYDVIIQSSTVNASEIIKQSNVKVVVSDQRMPGEAGIEFFKRLNSEFPQVIKILFTAYSNEQIALEAINKVGIYRFLTKPWNKNEIQIAVDYAIKEYDIEFFKNKLLVELQERNEAITHAYKKLDENEKKFHAVFANSNDCIYIINQKKEITEANQALLNLIGYGYVTFNIKDFNVFIKNTFPVLINKAIELSKKTGTLISDFEITVNPGERKTLEISSNEISYNNETFILAVLRDISERRIFEKKIIEAIIATQEESKRKYARELHDGLGPLLSTLKMHMEWIANPINSDSKENMDKIIQHSLYVVDDAIRRTKEIANNLSPHILQRFGLVNAIISYTDSLKESVNIEFIITSNLSERIENSVELVLYRTILECINNSVKHSEANKIILKFRKTNNLLLIEYSDNGKGFDVNKELTGGRGMGLFNMQNQIKHIDGKFEIVSGPEFGTKMSIQIDIG